VLIEHMLMHGYFSMLTCLNHVIWGHDISVNDIYSHNFCSKNTLKMNITVNVISSMYLWFIAKVE